MHIEKHLLEEQESREKETVYVVMKEYYTEYNTQRRSLERVTGTLKRAIEYCEEHLMVGERAHIFEEIVR